MKKYLPALFLFIALQAKADYWTQKAMYPGSGLELPISFSIGDKGYAGCGSGANDFWEYDPVNDTWTQKANVPGPDRRGGVGFSIGDKGYAGLGDYALTDFYEFDPLNNTWTTKASLSVGRGYGAGFSIGSKGYIGCGFSSIYLSDFWEYDPVLDSWTQKSSMPFARRQCTGFSILDKGYITTGYNSAYIALNDIWEYDPVGDTWTQKANIPAVGRGDARAFVICDKGYVMTGGENPFLDDLWQFDPQLNQWTQKTNVPNGGRDDGASFAINDKGYFGLGQLMGSVDAHDFWEYTPDVCNVTAPNFSASDLDLCEKFCINYFDSSTNNPTAWNWIFPGGDPSSSTDQNPVNICYNLPGGYDVTLITTNALGSDTLTLSNYITVYPTPPFPVIIQSGYTLTSSPATNYQWQFNSVDIAGATNQSYTITQTGFYTVVVGDSNGCVNATTLYVEITGVEDLSSDQNISIYPNPSNGNFIFEWTAGSIAGYINIDIRNTIGEVVFSSEELLSPGNFQTVRKEIELTNVPNGLYFIELSKCSSENITGCLQATRKLMIAK